MSSRKAAYYRRLGNLSGGIRWAKATSEHFAARSSRGRMARRGLASRRKRRRSRRSAALELDRIDIEVPAHSARRKPVERLAPLRKKSLETRPRSRLQQRLRALHSGEPRE